MDALAFLVGILAIVLSATSCCIYATYLYHMRRTKQLQIDEYDSQARFQLDHDKLKIMEKAMDKGLPPGRYGLD